MRKERFMSLKNYEKYLLLTISASFSFCIVFLLLIVFWNVKISIYQLYQGVFVDDTKMQFLVNNQEYKLLLQNSTLYLDHKKYSYEIIEVQKNVLRRKEYYHSVLLKYSGNKKRKVNDIASISIFQKKEKFITIFQIIWKDDLDGKTK